MYDNINATFDKHIMDSFEFESGAVLEDVSVEYVTRGTPQYDDDGNITNAIVYGSTLKGGYSIFDNHRELIKNQSLNKNYFFIKIVSLGAPDSCSPSSTGLRYDFPSYTFKDRVNFKRQFLAEKFKINKIFALIGEGMGGFEVYTWACEYPDEMEAIIVLNSSYKTHGYRYVLVKCAEAILDSCEDIYSESYSTALSKLSVAILRLLFIGYFPDHVFKNLNTNEIDVLMDDYVDDALSMDIHDFNSRNECILNYDVEDKLSNIKAKSLIMGNEDILLFNIEKDIIPLANLIENSTIKILAPMKKNYYDEDDFSELVNELASFEKKLRK